MDGFVMNGIYWHVHYVDPYSPYLVSRTGILSLATTDPISKCIYISSALSGMMLRRVMIHELGHCVMISYDLVSEVHKVVKPEYWVIAEEFLCNFIADYGMEIFEKLDMVIG